MAIDNVVGFEHCPLNCSFLKVVIFKDPQHFWVADEGQADEIGSSRIHFTHSKKQSMMQSGFQIAEWYHIDVTLRRWRAASASLLGSHQNGSRPGA